MLDFKPILIEDKTIYDRYLLDGTERSCSYSFANLFLWGRQTAAIYQGYLVLFSHFHCRSVYSYPIGTGNIKPVLDAIIADAGKRSIPCRLTGITPKTWQTLETLYPGRFMLHTDRASQDYVYEIDALAELTGRKYHGKRNHYNKFRETYPDCTVTPLTAALLPQVRQMLADWYEQRLQVAPDSDFKLEQAAIEKALRYYSELKLETLVLLWGEQVLAVTMGSRLSPDTFDIHFEKARAGIDGAYTAINCEFAGYLRNKYPEVRFLNREEDMGIEGLRKAKLSYHPHHMIEKDWAHLMEEGYDY